MNHQSYVGIAVLCVGFLSGCTGSVYPLLTEKDLLKDSDLSGEWMLEFPDKDGNVQKIPLTLERYDTSTYDLTIPEDLLKSDQNGRQAGPEIPDTWTFQVGKISDQLYAQLIPVDQPLGPLPVNGIPIYWFGKLALKDDLIEFTPVLDDRADVANKEKLPHIKYEPSIFTEMTAYTMPTAELQKAVVKHGDKLFGSKPLILRKVVKAEIN